MAYNGALSPTLIALTLLAACITFSNAEIDISQINVNDLQQKLPEQFANSNLTMDDAKALVRDKCILVAGEEKGAAAFAEIETSSMNMVECITGIVNYTAIQAEIDEASPRGELDVVFNKYCLKRPQALECVESFNAKLAPCLEKDEQDNQEVFMRIVRSLLNFICHKGGDQIALFIAEKGPECLKSKQDDILQCVNNTFSDYLPKDGVDTVDVKSLPKFVMGTKQCGEMEQLEECIVEKLEKCDEITPANIVESMFRFIKNETICRTAPKVAKQSGAKSTAATVLSYNGFALALAFSLFYAVTKRLQ